MGRVLVIDDNPHFIELVKYNLERDDIEVKTRRSKYFDVKADFSSYEMIISDLSLPGSDGISLCHEIKQTIKGIYPLFILLVPENIRLNCQEALHSGVDDIFLKPVRIMSLVDNVKTYLSMEYPTKETPSLNNLSLVENATVDQKSYRIIIQDEPINLSLMEFNLFKLFLCNPGKLFTYGQLYLELNAYGFFLGLNSIAFQINILNKKLHRFNFHFINVNDVGFKLEIA
jgi:DNA-binding response OmpR family regulator